MSKSFRLHLFMHLLFAAMVILVGNRQISQNFLFKQTEERIRTEMALDISVCQHHTGAQPDFVRCAENNQAGSVYNALKHYYLVCANQHKALSEKACHQLRQLDIKWESNPLQDGKGEAFSNVLIGGESWLASKNQETQDVVLLNRQWISSFVAQLWQIRDQNMSKSIPTVLISMLFLAIYMSFIVVRPLKLIENKMAQLNSQSLFLKESISSPYREFNQLIDVYLDLRKRLADSFIKARRFSSDVSHELRTPLSILRGNAERMISDLPVGSPEQVQVRLMSDEIERLILITEKLLLLSRADANSLQLEMGEMNLSQAVKDLFEDASSFHPNLQINHNIQDDVILMCDAQLIHQLIQNLYTNAVKYNKPNGWISIALTCNGQQLKLTIENPTQEISQDLVERGFERFYRGDASRTRGIDGVGLGLSICQEIAHVHRGTLELEVMPAQIVRLTLSVPLA